MPILARRIARILLALLIPLIVIIGAVRLLMTDQYLAFEYGKSSFPPDAYGFTPQERFDLASTDVHYVSAHLPEDALGRQTLEGAPVYNSREVAHMADVRGVFQSVLRLWHLSLVLSLFLAVLLWQTGTPELIVPAVQAGGLLTAGLITGIASLAIFAWATWFDLFHRLFFAPGSWLFAYTDTLIRLFPVEFWFDAVVTLGLISLAGGLLLALAGALAGGFTRAAQVQSA